MSVGGGPFTTGIDVSNSRRTRITGNYSGTNKAGNGLLAGIPGVGGFDNVNQIAGISVSGSPSTIIGALQNR